MYYPAYQDENTLRDSVKYQVEYYFSVDNLIKDLFLRSQMDSEGFIPLSVIAGFKRMAALSQDVEYISGVLADSTEVEIKDGKIRKRTDWEKFMPVPNAFSTQAPSFVPGQSFVPVSADTANGPAPIVTLQPPTGEGGELAARQFLEGTDKDASTSWKEVKTKRHNRSNVCVTPLLSKC